MKTTMTIYTDNVKINGLGGNGHGIRVVEMSVPLINTGRDSAHVDTMAYIGVIEDYLPFFPERYETLLRYYSSESVYQIVLHISEIEQKIEELEDTSQDYSKEYSQLEQENEELHDQLFNMTYLSRRKEIAETFADKYENLETIFAFGSLFRDSPIIFR